MGASGSKRDVVKTKVLAVGRLSMVRKRNSEKRQRDDLVKKREQAMSVFDDSSDGEISREDITSLPLKNGCHLSDGGQSEGKDRLSCSGLWDESRKGRVGSMDGTAKFPLTLNDFKKVTRKRTLDEFEDLPFNIPFETDEKVEVSRQCHVCEVFTGHEIYPCRICSKAFHKSCLQKLGRCQEPQDIALLHGAKSPTGWTCYLCDDVSNLLTEEELAQLMGAFRKLHIDEESKVLKAKFLDCAEKFHRESHSKNLSIEDLENEELKFKQIDRDNRGYISWRDFMNYHSVIMLQKRSKSLVPLLTEREIELARRLFREFKPDKNGKITCPTEAAVALRSWYTLFYSSGDSANGYALFSDDETQLSSHLRQNLPIIIETDTVKSGSLTWEQYLKDQAIYIIATRPNISVLPIQKTEWFNRMKNHISGTELRESGLNELTADQSDAKSDTSGLSSASIERLHICSGIK